MHIYKCIYTYKYIYICTSMCLYLCKCVVLLQVLKRTAGIERLMILKIWPGDTTSGSST